MTVEAAASLGWYRWADEEGTIIALGRFGASAPGEVVMRNLGFTVGHVTAAASRLLGMADTATEPLGIHTAARHTCRPRDIHSGPARWICG